MDRAALLKQLDLLAAWLECGEKERLILFGSHDEHEWLLRLSGIARSLLARHSTDGNGYCRLCREPRKGILNWLSRRRAPCQVLARARFFVTSELDVVWWQALSVRGDDITLGEVRAWLSSLPDNRSAESAKHAAITADERVRPYIWGDLPTSRMPAPPSMATTKP